MQENLLSRLPNFVSLEVRDVAGRLKEVIETTNLITNGGIDWVAGIMGNASGAPAKYIAVTEDTASASASDTTLASELTTHGLSRAAGTYAHTTTVRSFTLQKVFSVTGGPHTVAKSALFDTAVSGGIMVFEALFGTTATVNNTDSLTVTWTINF